MNTPLRCGPLKTDELPLLARESCAEEAARQFWDMPEPTSGIEKPDWMDAAVAWVQRHLIRIAAVCAVISFVVGCTAMLSN